MIKFVYFDVGGTAIKDFSKHPEIWEDFRNEFPFVSEEYWKKHCSPVLELGVIPKNLPISMDSFVEGFVIRFKQNPSIWESVKYAKSKVRVGLLTNMYAGMLDKIKKYNLLPPIDWDIVIDTSVVKMKKPEKPIFLLAQKESGVAPEEILFVDNVEKNLIVPKELGWQTFFYDSIDYEESSKKLMEFLLKNV